MYIETNAIDLCNLKNKVISFLWQHVLLIVSLFIMTLGVAVCVR